MESPDTEQRWFAENVQVHEGALRSYLRGHFPALHDLDDVVQEAYRRMIETSRSRQVGHPKAYLFATARNAALDFFRKKRPVSLEEIPDSRRLAVLVEEAPGAPELIDHDQELQLLAEAIEALPKRCRQVLKLRKIHGLGHEEIAARLGISRATVATQIGIGVRRCAEFMAARGLTRERDHGGT